MTCLGRRCRYIAGGGCFRLSDRNICGGAHRPRPGLGPPASVRSEAAWQSQPSPESSDVTVISPRLCCGSTSEDADAPKPAPSESIFCVLCYQHFTTWSGLKLRLGFESGQSFLGSSSLRSMCRWIS